MADNDQLLAQFQVIQYELSSHAKVTKITRSPQDITGENAERSKFYLESSNWQLDVALSSFYENTEVPAAAAAGATGQSGGDESMETEEGGGGGEKKAPAGKVTFGGGGSSSDSEDEGQAYYAGGSTTSGQQVRKK